MTAYNTPHSVHVEVLGNSDAFLAFQEHLSRTAQMDRPVLLLGERGTGKELAATRLHYLSPRWQQPLVTLNCAAIPESLMAPELFGHESGAFTGANKMRLGRFEHAHEGTLFLDEVGNMPLCMQGQILRVVEYGAFERVGGSKTISPDVRIIAATNADPVQLVRDGLFKADLLDRLSVEVLTLPPLRKRGNDAMLLAHHFAVSIAMELERSEAPRFSRQAERQIMEHTWPGNVRELKSCIERSVSRAEGNTIEHIILDPFASPWRQGLAEHSTGVCCTLPQASCPSFSPQYAPPDRVPGSTHIDLDTSLRQATHTLESAYLRTALERTRHNQREAAMLLGMTYHQFRGLYRKHKEAIVCP